MRSSLLWLLITFSFLSHAQEFDDLPDWARCVPEAHIEARTDNYNHELEQLTVFLRPKVKAAAIEWLRGQFCTKSMESHSRRIIRKVLTSQISHTQGAVDLILTKLGSEFLSRGFVFLLAGADITQVSELTFNNICNVMVQLCAESMLSNLIVKNSSDGFFWRIAKDVVRSEIASCFIGLSKTQILPALKKCLIEVARDAIIAQKENEKRMPRIFKERVSKKRRKYLNGNYTELSYERSPILIHSKWLQKSTR